MSGIVGSLSNWLHGSTSGTGGSIWLLLFQQKTRKLSNFFICWTGNLLAEDEDNLLDYKVQLF